MRLPHSFIAALCAGMIAAPLLAAAPARAQEVESREAIALRDQIAELRQEIQMMQQAQQSGGPVPSSLAPPPQMEAPQNQGQGPGLQPGGSDSVAELVVRVSTLEEQNRQLQGRVDDLANQLQRQNDALTKQIGDLAFKLGQGSPGAPPEAAPDNGGVPPPPGAVAGLIAQPPPNAVAPRPVVPPLHRTPEMALRDGAAALARRDYPAAEALAREALAKKGPRGNDAQFLLARAEGGQHKYREATADFYLAYNHAPKSPTAPIALLGVANSLIALNDGHDACEALAKLTVEFPHLSEGVRAGVAGARKRAACAR